MFRGKKGQVVTAIIVIILILLILWVANAGSRECHTDRNCGKEYYCGSDFRCHEKEQIVVKSNDLVIPSLILAVALVICAVILRLNWQRKKKEPEQAGEGFKYY